eukprot:464273-Ditylum_brightwellii.AAC.1
MVSWQHSRWHRCNGVRLSFLAIARKKATGSGNLKFRLWGVMRGLMVQQKDESWGLTGDTNV